MRVGRWWRRARRSHEVQSRSNRRLSTLTDSDGYSEAAGSVSVSTLMQL
jgi:hypothetical protein